MTAQRATKAKKTRYVPAQLKHYLYRKVAHELDSHIANGSEWLYPEELTKVEQAVLREMLDELVNDLDLKVDKLFEKLVKLRKEPIR